MNLPKQYLKIKINQLKKHVDYNGLLTRMSFKLQINK